MKLNGIYCNQIKKNFFKTMNSYDIKSSLKIFFLEHLSQHYHKVTENNYTKREKRTLLVTNKNRQYKKYGI